MCGITFFFQMDRFKHVPRGVLAHSTHVRGGGTFAGGKETGRIDVILATSISPTKCQKINLGYMNPDEIKFDNYKGKESTGILLVEHAGEVLYKSRIITRIYKGGFSQPIFLLQEPTSI